ncbi:hypothetical protein SHELI_v1c09990 [Spiroplasma helicoides]|uniref:Uncharacterized protein n=1 Tax=Spiroplasma helicoides TaxID=216938 RepID=A0A1B3SLY0_9MOLU|nr:ABC transporter permease [Spiroplasma helicoides]AOG60946.1 hypothetical protein SHELI_v1c09990 [Spiroplasma helicoides]
MKHVILFNIGRNFKNKYFILVILLSVIGVIASNFSLFILNTSLNTDKTVMILIFSSLFWIILLFYVNLVFISNAMVQDSNNGILNLELAKKFRHSELLFYKLFANKLITIPLNIFLMVVLYLGLYIVNPINFDYYSSSVLFGYLTFFLLDLVFSCLLIFFCSFKKTRIVYFLSSSVFVFYLCSPIIGKVHMSGAQSDFNYLWEPPNLQTQSLLDLEKLSYQQDGVVYNLMKNFSSLNDDYSYKITAKNSQNDSCSNEEYECLYQADTVGDMNFYKYMGGYSYVAQSGLMLDSTYFLNNSVSTNKNFSYEISPNYSKNKIYQFLINTLYPSDNKNHYEDTFYYQWSAKNLKGPSQLNDYSMWLLNDEAIAKIKTTLNLNISNGDIKKELYQLNQIIIRDFIYTWSRSPQEYFDSRFYLADKWEHNSVNGSWGRQGKPKLNLINERDLYNKALLKDGNRLYMAIFFTLIDRYLNYNMEKMYVSSNKERTETKYYAVKSHDLKYLKYFIENPFYFHQYLLMYLNPNMGFANEQLTMTNSYIEPLPVRAYLYEQNSAYEELAYNEDASQNGILVAPRQSMYQDFDKIFTKEIKLTNRIVDTNFVVLGYIIFSLLLGVAGFSFYKLFNVI